MDAVWDRRDQVVFAKLSFLRKNVTPPHTEKLKVCTVPVPGKIKSVYIYIYIYLHTLVGTQENKLNNLKIFENSPLTKP